MTNKMVNSRPIKMWIDGKIFNVPMFNKNVKKLKNREKETAFKMAEVKYKKIDFEKDSKESSEIVQIKIQEITSKKAKHLGKVHELLEMKRQATIQENSNKNTLEIELGEANLKEFNQKEAIFTVPEVELQESEPKETSQTQSAEVQDVHFEDSMQKEATSKVNLPPDNFTESKQTEIACEIPKTEQQTVNLEETKEVKSEEIKQNELISDTSNVKLQEGYSEEFKQKDSFDIYELEQVYSEYLQLLDIKEDNGKFITHIKLPKLYYTKLQNIQNFSIKKLSEETNSKISLPKFGQEGNIIIQSEEGHNLVEAVSQIHSAVSEIRQRNIPLQFVCIPCSNETIKESFLNLKKKILSMRNEVDGLHESIFMCPLKLHVTIDVYALLDDREKAEAIHALNSYKTTLQAIRETVGSFKLNIAGLDCMNDNIKKVDVLYAKIKLVEETDDFGLQKIVNDISEHFYNRGLAKKYQDNVKLHMTVINTKYRKNFESPKRKRRRQSIDATRILEKFKDYNFGCCDFDSLHLSHISVKGEDGFYKPLAVLQLADSKDIK